MKNIRMMPGAVYLQSDDGRVAGVIWMGEIQAIERPLCQMGYENESLKKAIKDFYSGKPIKVLNPKEGLFAYLCHESLTIDGEKIPIDMLLSLVTTDWHDKDIKPEDLLSVIKKDIRLRVPPFLTTEYLKKTIEELVSYFHGTITGVPQLA